MSVGFEQVRWEEGKVIAFDDTFIHQVGTKSHLREEEIEFFFFSGLWSMLPTDAT